ILSAVAEIAAELPVVFPVHPRTQARVKEFGLEDCLRNGQVAGPMRYIDFLSLRAHARIVLPDSGGLQEESTALGIPCLTLRENTERPVTVTHGTNRVVGTKTATIVDGVEQALASTATRQIPELWDGHAAERVAAV